VKEAARLLDRRENRDHRRGRRQDHRENQDVHRDHREKGVSLANHDSRIP